MQQAKQRLRECWLWSRAYTVSGGSSEMMRNILAKRRLMLPSQVSHEPHGQTYWGLVEPAAREHPDRVVLCDDFGRCLTTVQLRDAA